MNGEQILGGAGIVSGLLAAGYGFRLARLAKKTPIDENPLQATDYFKFFAAPLFPVHKYKFLRLRYVAIYLIVIGFTLIIAGFLAV